MDDTTQPRRADTTNAGPLTTLLRVAYLLRPTKAALNEFGWYILGGMGAAISCWLGGQAGAARLVFGTVVILAILWSIGYACNRPSEADRANVP